MKRLVLLIAILVAGPVQAITVIEVDPGAIGDPFLNVNFTLDADDNELEFLFSDMKHVEVFLANPDLQFGKFGLFLNGPSNQVNDPITWTAFLSNEFGGKIDGTDFFGTSGNTGSSFFPFRFEELIVFHDVHYTADAGLVFPAGDYGLFSPSTPSLNFGTVVGEWGTVPEPTTLLLLGLGLAGLGFARRRLHSPAPTPGGMKVGRSIRMLT